MPDRIERLRLDVEPDGSAIICLELCGDLPAERVEERARCTAAAPHVHGWASCDVRALFRAQPSGPGSSLLEKMGARLAQLRAAAAIEAQRVRVPIPTRKNAKGEDEEDREIRGL